MESNLLLDFGQKNVEKLIMRINYGPKPQNWVQNAADDDMGTVNTHNFKSCMGINLVIMHYLY